MSLHERADTFQHTHTVVGLLAAAREGEFVSVQGAAFHLDCPLPLRGSAGWVCPRPLWLARGHYRVPPLSRPRSSAVGSRESPSPSPLPLSRHIPHSPPPAPSPLR